MYHLVIHILLHVVASLWEREKMVMKMFIDLLPIIVIKGICKFILLVEYYTITKKPDLMGISNLCLYHGFKCCQHLKEILQFSYNLLIECYKPITCVVLKLDINIDS